MQSVFDRIYAVVRQIPCGRVATYGMVAQLAGNPRWARVVGYALHVNPEPGVIPCHRVVMRDGAVSSAFAFGARTTATGSLPSFTLYSRISRTAAGASPRAVIAMNVTSAPRCQ